ncbi:MAG: DeoR/GlpR family DNA-binding transcription regulator [Propionicimonas sp.]
MIPFQRRERILEILNTSEEVVFIDELVSAVGVSASTVRRDVNALVEEGEVVALRGGAVKINDRVSELPATAKALINKDAKRTIAAEAAKLVQDGDVIYVDSGTTTLQLLPYLKSVRVKIVTSNTSVLGMPEATLGRIILLGGDYLPDLGSIVGPMTERELADLYFDSAFIGANGCSRESGISTFDMREATKKRLAHERSRESYVLLDQTKFGKSAFCKALELDQSTIITDAYDEILESAKGYRIARDPSASDGVDAAPAEDQVPLH